MTFHPKVSIIIPVYNGSNFLKEAIESALAQTYDNTEVIVINDGSTDDGQTATIARAYGKKIQYFEKENGGVATALNLGVEKMTGTYASWLSHDDLYTPNKLLDQIEFLKSNPDDRQAVLYGDFSLIDEGGTLIYDVHVPTIPPSQFILKLVSSSPVHGCTTLVPKICFETVGNFNPKLRTTQDYDLWFRMARKFRFIHVKSNGVLSRQHDKQDSRILSPLMARESIILYLHFLECLTAEPKLWETALMKPAAYREMAFGLIDKQCFIPARFAFRLYQKEKGFTWRIPFEIVAFEIKISLLKSIDLVPYLSRQFRTIYHKLFRREPAKENTSHRKILLITPAFAPIPGGLAEQSALLAETLNRLGHRVDVVTEQMQPTLPFREIIDGIHIYRLPPPRTRNSFGLFILSMRLIEFLIRHRHDYDFCIVRTITSQAVVVGFMKTCRLIQFRTIITAETGGEDDEIRALAKQKFYKIIVYFINKNDFINSNNSANYQHYLELGFTKSKLTKIYNGVRTDDYAQATYPTKIERFIFLAELNREKGIRELLDAFKLVHKTFPRVKLVIGGYGKEEDYIKQFIAKERLHASIQFVGYVPKNAKKTFFARGDCFVFPSYSEGFGLVVAEAVVYKRAIISTRVADFEDIYGSMIQFCTLKDSHDLAEKMKKLILEFDQKLFNYDEVIQKLSIQRTAREFLELCSK